VQSLTHFFHFTNFFHFAHYLREEFKMNTQAGCEQGNGLTLLKIVRKDEKCLIYKYIFKRKEGIYGKQG